VPVSTNPDDRYSVVYRYPADGIGRKAAFVIPFGGNKGSLAWDSNKKLLYYGIGITNSPYSDFAVIDLNTQTIVRKMSLFAQRDLGSGLSSYYERMHLTMSGDDLVAAWGTSGGNPHIKYRTFSFMKTADAGLTWTTMAGAAITPPIVADETGPADHVDFSAYLDKTHVFISNTSSNANTVSFIYTTYGDGAIVAPTLLHYARYNKILKQVDIQNDNLKGATFTLNGTKNQIITLDSATSTYQYVISLVSSPSNMLVVIRSADGGLTWQDYARAEVAPYGDRNKYLLEEVKITKNVAVDGIIYGTITLSEKTTGKYFIRPFRLFVVRRVSV